MNNNKKYIALIPLITVLLLELISRGGLIGVCGWIIRHPEEFILTYTILFGLFNLFYFLPRRIYLIIGTLLLCFFSFVGIVSREKLLLRGEPLLPWDLSLGKEVFNVTQGSGSSEYPIWILIAIGIMMVLTIVVILITVPREKYQTQQKVTVAVLSMALFYSLTFQIPLMKTFSLNIVQYSQQSNYEQNGVLLGFLLDYKFYTANVPTDYNHEQISEIVKQVKTNYSVDANFTPNVIFIQSEAFWDPTLMKNITYSQDPIPYFHSLQNNYTSGTMLVPVFGGGTVNTEFEVLTGYSCEFLTPGAVSYVCYVDRQLDALPAIYNKQGYESTAIHTYDNWFYRRNLVFADMGFNKFISKEFFVDPERRGDYIRDTELTNKILEQVEQSEKPDFIYAISMENHGPYSTKQNPANTITVQGSLSTASKTMLENYANNISDVDQSLKLLIDGLKAINEPTIVVFYGDHLPMLGNDSEVYKEAGYFQSSGDYAEYLKKYSVPFVVWDNFTSLEEREKTTFANGNLRISANYLGSYILKMSKKEGNTLTDFLYTLYQKGSTVLADSIYRQYEKITTEEIADYELLQYDTLSGDAFTYALKPSDEPADNTGYTLGEASPEIDNVRNTADNTIQIKGVHFLPDVTVYINGKPLDTTFIDSTLLTAALSGSLANNTGDLQIQLKVSDSLDNVIMESNTVTFKKTAAVSDASK